MINLETILSLSDYRKTEDIQLWGVGCSFTVGIGVDPTKCYINLIAEKLAMPLTKLAAIASSIPWAADQILRSDIRNGDIVIWGLTSSERLTYYDNNYLHNVNYASNLHNRLVPDSLLVSDQLKYQALIAIHQVINYCKKINAKLLIGGLLPSQELTEMLENNKEYFLAVPHYYKFNLDQYIDLGTDNVHPGPKQHQLYAENFIEELKLRNFI